MPNHSLQRKIIDLPLFRQPNIHQIIWKNLSKQQQSQLMELMSRMISEHQKRKGENYERKN